MENKASLPIVDRQAVYDILKGMTEEIKEVVQQAAQEAVKAPLDKIVPKFCTSINLALLNNKNLVISMIYNEDNHNIALIDRIVIDKEHAVSLRTALDKVIKEAEDAREEDNDQS